MQIEVVFVDIDGTIVHDNQVVTSAREAIARLQASGRTVVLCTGRSVLHARPVQADLNLPSMVCFNGGLTQMHGEIIDSHPLAPEVVNRIVDLALKESLPLVLHTASEALVPASLPPQVMPVLAEYDFPPLKNVSPESLLHYTVYQGNILADASYDAEIKMKIPECFLYRWHDIGMDLQKLHCDKSVGALALLERLGVAPEHAMHFGDGGNDIGMFALVGTSVAMGNAEPGVKEHAKYVTDDVDRDGFYSFCEQHQLFDPIQPGKM